MRTYMKMTSLCRMPSSSGTGNINCIFMQPKEQTHEFGIETQTYTNRLLNSLVQSKNTHSQ